MTENARVRIRCRGVVQGVGFRPAVYRLAASLGLSGWVLNGPDGVVLEVEGPQATVAAFSARLRESLPPLARLEEVEEIPVPPLGEAGFRVLESETGPRRSALVPPDAALCADCRREMEDPSDRRHRFPFTTCTNCGPRFTLVRALPYDRERTSMACFPLCPPCRAEYEDPGDRRFHAEPVSCPSCGPRLWLALPSGERVAEGQGALEEARRALTAGKIVAVKGLGGFQLACRADLGEAVLRLRDRKGRPTKPFAVMAGDLGAARRLARLSSADEDLLLSPRGPIVLAPKASPFPLAEAVAPGLGDVGVMVPTTPLHVELFRGAPYPALVMTSGNRSDEPIALGNREALRRLGGLAELFLLHDRDVVRRADDSVVRAVPRGHALVRRSRGYVPEALPLGRRLSEPLTALGGHLQAAGAVAVGEEVFLTQHVGDLDTDGARGFLREAVSGMEEFLEVRPRLLAADLHPDYPSTWLGESLAREREGRLLRLQHHAAHGAAVLGEHRRRPEGDRPCLCLVFDGTGFGPDGTAWGGEWLLLHEGGRWERLARLEAVPLVGGEAAVREPWRVAAAALAREGFAQWEALPLAGLVAPERLRTAAALAGGPWPRATGAGRLFEAAGALLGLAAVNGYEGEAAVRLESLAAAAPGEPPWEGLHLAFEGGLLILPFGGLLAAAARRLGDGEAPVRVAAGLHATFCRLAAEVTARVLTGREEAVAAGGGCLVNRLLREGLGEAHGRGGVELLLPWRVPPGDGGLAYGQAVLAAWSAP